MNYKELLYNKDKVLTFYPELAVILNKFDEIESKRISEETGELKKPDKTGLNKAIFLNQLNYWIELNEQSGINFEDGYYWSNSSSKSSNSIGENDTRWFMPMTLTSSWV